MKKSRSVLEQYDDLYSEAVLGWEGGQDLHKAFDDLQNSPGFKRLSGWRQQVLTARMEEALKSPGSRLATTEGNNKTAGELVYSLLDRLDETLFIHSEDKKAGIAKAYYQLFNQYKQLLASEQFKQSPVIDKKEMLSDIQSKLFAVRKLTATGLDTPPNKPLPELNRSGVSAGSSKAIASDADSNPPQQKVQSPGPPHRKTVAVKVSRSSAGNLPIKDENVNQENFNANTPIAQGVKIFDKNIKPFIEGLFLPEKSYVVSPDLSRLKNYKPIGDSKIARVVSWANKGTQEIRHKLEGDMLTKMGVVERIDQLSQSGSSLEQRAALREELMASKHLVKELAFPIKEYQARGLDKIPRHFIGDQKEFELTKIRVRALLDLAIKKIDAIGITADNRSSKTFAPPSTRNRSGSRG